MDRFIEKLRQSDPERFADFLRSYLQGGAPALDPVPPSERLPLAFARLVSAEAELCKRTRAALPDLMAELSTLDSDHTVERAMTLYGFCRAAGATRAVIALTDELDRQGRNVDLCVSAIAAQSPSELMLDFLLRKGMHPLRTSVCLRALLRLDRRRAAQLLAQRPTSPVTETFLRSALEALLVDERIDAMKELYLARPTLPRSLLRLSECITKVSVVQSDDEYFVIGLQNHSVSVRSPDPETTNVLSSAAERTSPNVIAFSTHLGDRSGQPGGSR